MPRRFSSKPSILYCASHRVNYVMYDPIYQRLRKRNDVWLGVSSGRYRRHVGFIFTKPSDPEQLNEYVFGEFDIDPRHIIKTSCHDTRQADVYVTSNRSDRIRPQNPRTTVQIFHGVSFRNFAVNAGYLKFDKLFFPGRYHLEKYLEAGLLKEGDPRIELIGMPKVDRLVDGTFTREAVLKGFGLDPARKTVVWCPTGANDNSIDVLGAAGLRAVQDLDVNLIVKLHDHMHLKDGRTYEGIEKEVEATFGPNGRLARSSDVTPLLVAADLLISDASSVAYEFTILDRPIIFVDVPKLLAYRETLPDCKMDMNTHGRRMGRIVKTSDELREAVREELAQPGTLSAERRAAAGHIFHQPGTATERVVNRLLELARK